MRVIRGQSRPVAAPVGLAIGNFDGVHRGHAALVRQLAEAAGQLAQDGALQSVGNLSAGAQAELINRGRGMFHEIVGTPAINALSLGVSKHSDISFASSTSLVAFAAPLVLG